MCIGTSYHSRSEILVWPRNLSSHGLALESLGFARFWADDPEFDFLPPSASSNSSLLASSKHHELSVPPLTTSRVERTQDNDG